jgi:hypothetical protein
LHAYNEEPSQSHIVTERRMIGRGVIITAPSDSNENNIYLSFFEKGALFKIRVITGDDIEHEFL